MKKLKVNLIAAIAIAIGTLTMSFQLLQPEQQNYEWHERQLDGSYILMPGAPAPNPANGCEEDTDELCAKGFLPGTAPSEVTDATPAAQERFQPEIN